MLWKFKYLFFFIKEFYQFIGFIACFLFYAVIYTTYCIHIIVFIAFSRTDTKAVTLTEALKVIFLGNLLQFIPIQFTMWE